jgi:hydroxymethylbilane synthase
MAANRSAIIGTRGSALALKQTQLVEGLLLEQNPGLKIEQTTIRTKGDAVLDTALSKIGDKGLFVKEIETALLEGQIDIAVHSLKDLPTESPDELIIAAIPKREDPSDVFIGKDGQRLENLLCQAVIATSSLRRKSQLLAFRPDLKIIDIRGNVGTRLRKFQEGDINGIILARAGLKRLGLEQHVTQIMDFNLMLPAPAQGALGIQVRRDDHRMLEIVGSLNDLPTFQAVTAERSFLKALEGGCQIPIGALCHLDASSRLTLEGKVISLDGSRVIKGIISVDPGNPEAAGIELAQQLLKQGAESLLEEIRRANEQ